jgi:threonylcarbamoyladenosine tRNA methylthiotransferase MtaB
MAREEFVLDGTAEFDCTRATLKIQDGCDVRCSFCIIPFARGRSRSRALTDVLREGGELAARGHKELVLSGVNIGEYESGGAKLVDLIKLLELLPGLERIRISSIEPTTVTDDLLDHMARSNRLCRHLHIPLQSGSDAVLRAMNRPYGAEDFGRLIERAFKLMPEVCIGTDLLVGFPGEQPEQHEATISLVSALPIAYFHVFPYSARPGTPAARMAGQLPAATITGRTARLTGLSRAKRLAYYQRFIGHSLYVLFERSGKDLERTGLTDNYLRVNVVSDEDLANTIRPVEITAVLDGLALGHLLSSNSSGVTPLPLFA